LWPEIDTLALRHRSGATAWYKAAADLRGTPPYRTKLVESVGFGLHLVDYYQLPLDDLIELVSRQASALP
jgi:hypothetical protein